MPGDDLQRRLRELSDEQLAALERRVEAEVAEAIAAWQRALRREHDERTDDECQLGPNYFFDF